jgi:hypothetical protein
VSQAKPHFPALHVAVAPDGDEHAEHNAPAAPHAETAVPEVHWPFAQHPLQDVASHTHLPAAQWSPGSHVPLGHVPPQSSVAPHALPAQEGVHCPAPHTFGPPAPQVKPAGHPPQSTTSRQALVTFPHFPAHARSSLQLPASGSARAASGFTSGDGLEPASVDDASGVLASNPDSVTSPRSPRTRLHAPTKKAAAVARSARGFMDLALGAEVNSTPRAACTLCGSPKFLWG